MERDIRWHGSPTPSFSIRHKVQMRLYRQVVCAVENTTSIQISERGAYVPRTLGEERLGITALRDILKMDGLRDVMGSLEMVTEG